MANKKKLLLLLLLLYKKLLAERATARRTRVIRRYWVHPLNAARSSRGTYQNLVQDLRRFPSHHRRYLRMTAENFDRILSLVSPILSKQNTVMRKAIEPGLKLAVTLHHLAEGTTHSNIALHYRLGRSTVSGIIYDTCQAIWTALQPLYLNHPQGPEDWKAIAKGFETWNFPHCIGSIDGKHVLIRKPKHSGSEFHNYKHTESVVLLAVCDSAYKFTLVDIGQSGSQSDGGILESSEFGRALLHGRINLPEPEPLPGNSTSVPIPYMFVGDEAFPLKPYLMRPFPGRQLNNEEKRVYNYRLSRARRVIENTFGILSQRWRLLFRPIIAEPSKAALLVKAMCVLHNFLRSEADQQYTPPGFVDSVDESGVIQEGFWRDHQLSTLGEQGHSSRSATVEATNIREQLVTFLSSPEGSVPWQLSHVNAR